MNPAKGEGASGAFKGSRATAVVVGTKKLTRKSVRGAFGGSKVKTVKVQVKKPKATKGLSGKKLRAAKKYNKKAKAYNEKIARKYAEFMTAGVVGKRVMVTA